MVPAVLPDSTDQVYTVTLAGERRLDLIAYMFYGASELWWVVALVNGLKDPLVGVKYGTQLRIPLKSRLAGLGILNI